MTRDISAYADDEAHGEAIAAALEAIDGVSVESTVDRVFMSHAGGKVGMQNRVPVASRDDLSMAYTPGVARVCMAIHHDFEQAWDYTIKGNSVMVVSDGSSVVGQGDLGPEASLPALEAKCAFLRKLAGIDAFPLPVDLRDPAEIAEAVALCSSVFAGIHLSDIAAPRCFEVQRLLDERLDIPVFHDDQQGTAAAVLAALGERPEGGGQGPGGRDRRRRRPRPRRPGGGAAAGGGGRGRGDRLRLEGRRHRGPRRPRRRAAPGSPSTPTRTA